MNAIRSSFRLLQRNLTEHIDLIPLFGSLAFAGALSIGFSYHSIWKNDVEFNRWKEKPKEHESVAWDKPDQKLLVVKPSRSVYQDDPLLRDLLREVYEDGRYGSRQFKNGHDN